MRNRSNNIFSFFILILIVLGLLSCVQIKLSADKQAKQFYKQGLEFYNQKKYQDSYYNFSQIKKYSNLYELALLKEYQCARNLSDKKTAYLKLKTLRKTTKNSYILPYVIYNEIELEKELMPYMHIDEF